ncbi:TIGR03766 family XrtG-associated glycosyltransferase [Liquorilactobacillus vini]|uniref:TIGR03766 family XrtG-associated glycosyltransferase n=1 Tax=Liquorilactobacillus vini TaxID=238015 RepID=UPI0002DE5237|nr:TIGR03766 family XrtG-associated glycosyltransferase [Liquorilactobacillus vini]
MKQLFNFSRLIINIFWTILFGITLFFAWTSVNLIVGDNYYFGTSTTLITTGLLIGSLVILISLVVFRKERQLFRWIFIKHKLLTALILLLLVFAFQIFFVAFVHPVSGFDSGMLHYAATNPKHVQEASVISYYSVNDNNLPIMLLMRWLVVVTGQTSWMFFDYITLILVDLSAILNILTIAVIQPRLTAAAIYFQAGWLAVFPTIIMPYTDAWVLPLVSLYLLSYFIVKKSHWSIVIKAAAAIIFGISVTLTYFMKPSAIIPVVAIIMIECLNGLQKKPLFNKRTLAYVGLSLILIGGSGIVTYRLTKQQIQGQQYIELQSGRSIPAIHFMAMGVYGEGGYSEKQALKMVVLPTKKQRVAYSKKMLSRRLKSLGPLGYAKFLIKKQGNNTADGTFGWLKEGHFFRDNQRPSEKGLSNKLKNFIYLYGRNIADFRFLAQVWWVFLLTVIALGLGAGSQFKEREIFKLALIGGFLFLLLFEGGRSRYMIQYLPVWLSLGIISWPGCLTNCQRTFAWLTNENFLLDDSK